MSYEPHLAFMNSKTLGQTHSLETLIRIIQQLGYSVHRLKVGDYQNSIASWDVYDQQTQRELKTAYENKQLEFTARHIEEDFELLFYLNWQEYTYVDAVSFQTALFTRRENDPSYHAHLFLELGKGVYAYLVPDFGWLDICQTGGYTWYDDIEELKIPHIYWANFFSPAYVRKYGREKLLTGPAWLVEELGDGGILYVLGESLAYGSEYAVSPESVKGYLDV